MTNCQDEICELYLKWIEIYGKKPRCSIAKNGVDLKLKEMTDEEKRKTEDLVNKWIQEGLPVTKEEMKKEDAIKSGAECMFIEKYPDIVTVYTIGDVSKELCGGPHVNNTKELGKFKIKKEESSSSGVRRIKAVLIKE